MWKLWGVPLYLDYTVEDISRQWRAVNRYLKAGQSLLRHDIIPSKSKRLLRLLIRQAGETRVPWTACHCK